MRTLRPLGPSVYLLPLGKNIDARSMRSRASPENLTSLLPFEFTPLVSGF